MPTVNLLLKATGLRDADTFGKSDPLFKVCNGDTTVYTSETIDNNLNPEWAIATFELPEDFEKLEEPGKELRVNVYDEDNGNKADDLGTFVLNYPFRIGSHTFEQITGKETGTIEVMADDGEYYVPPVVTSFFGGSTKSEAKDGEGKTSSGCFSCFGSKKKAPKEKSEDCEKAEESQKEENKEASKEESTKE